MIYTKTLTIPANRSADNTVKEIIEVCRGLIYRVEIQFPPGCGGLVSFAMFDGAHQMYPSTMGDWFRLDDSVVAFDDLYLKMVPPWEFDLIGYNLDDTWEHNVYIRLGMVDKDEFMARFMPTIGYEKIMALQKEEQAKQEEERKAIAANPFPWMKSKRS